MFQSPLNLLSLLETSLISDARSIMRDSLCMIAQARASLAQSNTHAQCAETQEWRNTDCGVVTMALVSDFSHPESIILLKGILTDSVHGRSLLVELFQRHLLPASSVHNFFTITTGRYFSVIASIAIFSIPSVACTVFFLQTCFETCQRLSLPFSPAFLHLSQPHRQRL